MSNYSQSLFFGPKDALAHLDPLKVARGTQIDTELSLISTAIASKLDSGASIAASQITSGTVALARGGTGADLSATGAATAVLAQDASHTITARALIAADIPSLDTAKITTGTMVDGRIAASNVTQFQTSASNVGYLNIPQNSQSGGSYGLVLTDTGKHILCGATFTYTIPANASIAYPIGTVLTFYNSGGSNCSIAITTDVMLLAGTATTGTRTLASGGLASALKVGAAAWVISGAGLS